MMSYDLVIDLRNKYVKFEFIIIGLTIKCPDQKQKVRRLNGDKIMSFVFTRVLLILNSCNCVHKRQFHSLTSLVNNFNTPLGHIWLQNVPLQCLISLILVSKFQCNNYLDGAASIHLFQLILK